MASRHHVLSTVNKTVILSCHPQIIADVDWMYQTSETAQQHRVYQTGDIFEDYVDRFTTNRTDNGVCSLIINYAQLNDSGIYTCIEDTGFNDTKHLFYVNVTGEL